MKNVLILITSAFPYGKGEEFLLEETKFYEKFKEVHIIPISRQNFQKKKHIDESIILHPLHTYYSNNILVKTVKSLQSIFYIETLKEILYLRKTNRLSVYSLKRLFVESYKVRSVIKEIINIVKNISSKNPNDKIILYSYWMGNHAKIAIEVKKRLPSIKIVSRCHGGDLYEYRHPSNYIPFRKDILQFEDVIFPISEDGKKYLNNQYVSFKLPIIVSRLGTNRLYPINRISNKAGLNIVSCSYCVSLKRIDLIIRALSNITVEGITWTHIGNGIEFEKLRSLADTIIPSNISFDFLGYVENSKIQELYSNGNFNLFINVSETEGIPVSIMEAMSYGLPIIATNVGGVSEMVFDKKNGYLLNKDFEINDLKMLIEELYSLDEDKFELLSKESLKIWENKFSSKNNYPKFIDWLIKV